MRLLDALFVVMSLAPLIANAAARRRRRAARRQLTGGTETPIAAAKGGEKVCIRGSARARAPLRTSPILRRRCIGYRVMLDRHEPGLGIWRRVLDDVVFDSFVVVDATGEAVVQAPFEIKLEPDNSSAGGTPPPALLELLEREGIPIHGVLGDVHQFQFAETVLVPGDEIIAVGYATIVVDPAGRALSHRAPPVICQLNGAGDEKVVIAEAQEEDG